MLNMTSRLFSLFFTVNLLMLFLNVISCQGIELNSKDSSPSLSPSHPSLTSNNHDNNNMMTNEDDDFEGIDPESSAESLIWLEKQLEEHSSRHPNNLDEQQAVFLQPAEASQSQFSGYFVDEYPLPMALKARNGKNTPRNGRFRTRRYPFPPGAFPSPNGSYRRKARIGSDGPSSRITLSPGSFQLASFLTDSYGLKDGRGVRFGLS